MTMDNVIHYAIADFDGTTGKINPDSVEWHDDTYSSAIRIVQHSGGKKCALFHFADVEGYIRGRYSPNPETKKATKEQFNENPCGLNGIAYYKQPYSDNYVFE